METIETLDERVCGEARVLASRLNTQLDILARAERLLAGCQKRTEGCDPADLIQLARHAGEAAVERARAEGMLAGVLVLSRLMRSLPVPVREVIQRADADKVQRR